MAKFNVMINLTRTTGYSVEIEVTAKDEESAEAKAVAKVEALQGKDEDIVKALDMETTEPDDDSFEYSVTEA